MSVSGRQSDGSEEGPEAGLPPTPVPAALCSRQPGSAGQVRGSICQEGAPGASESAWRPWRCGRETPPAFWSRAPLCLHSAHPRPHLHVATLSASLRLGPRWALLAGPTPLGPGGPLPSGSQGLLGPLPGGRAGESRPGEEGRGCPLSSLCILPGRLSPERSCCLHVGALSSPSLQPPRL